MVHVCSCGTRELYETSGPTRTPTVRAHMHTRTPTYTHTHTHTHTQTLYSQGDEGSVGQADDQALADEAAGVGVEVAVSGPPPSTSHGVCACMCARARVRVCSSCEWLSTPPYSCNTTSLVISTHRSFTNHAHTHARAHTHTQGTRLKSRRLLSKARDQTRACHHLGVWMCVCVGSCVHMHV